MSQKVKIIPGILLCFLLIFGLSLTTISAQQVIPENSFLYSDNEVARIDISINPDSLASILEGDLYNDKEYPANIKMTRAGVTKTVENVGFRLRGNTSRNSRKKSFKVSINTYTAGKNFEGVEKINLNGEHNDPSISRAKICWDLFRDIGIPAPRSNHIELYINGLYRGLYMNVEQIDERFADFYFNNNSGNLYKCLWPADLSYIGSNPDQYKYMQDGRRVYELSRNKDMDDYSDLLNFIDILNNKTPEDFQTYLEPVFNVNSYLKNLVVEIMTGHWDAYSYNKNNYFLYHNQNTGEFEYIPYDTDNTFGIDWFGIDWASRDIYNWANTSEKRPLYKKIMQNQIYRDRFTFYTNRFISNYFAPEIIEPNIFELRNRIAPFAEKDNFMTLDYGWVKRPTNLFMVNMS
jgi:spore coat protein CotH